MDREAFRQAGYRAIDRICDYFDTLDQRPVAAQVQRGFLAEALPDHAPEEGEPWSAIEADYDAHILRGTTHWQHPSFMAFFPSNVTYEGILADMYAAATNNPGFNWAASPSFTELEFLVLDWIAKMLGLAPAFHSNDPAHEGGGVITASASEACLTAAIAAREAALRQIREEDAPDLATSDAAAAWRGTASSRLVMYATTQTHSIAAKAAMILGLRFRALEVRLEDEYALRGDTLRAAIEEDTARGLVPFMLVATYGTTSTCAIDNIPEVCAVAREYPKMWVHIDAAYGGVTFALPEARPEAALEAINADCHSFSTNLHKWGLVNIECSPLWVRDRRWLVAALSITPEYLKTSGVPQESVTDLRNMQITLGRRFRGLRVWCVLRSYGVSGFRAHLRHSIALGQLFARLVAAHPRIELPVPPRWGLVVFNVPESAGGDEATRRMYAALEEHNAQLMLTPTVLPGIGYAHNTNMAPPHAWAPSVTPDVPMDTRVRAPNGTPHYRSQLSPITLLPRAALIAPNKVAVVHPEAGYSFTYAEFAERALSLAFALRTVPGWQQGDRVAIISPNVPLILEAHYGVPAAGGVLTPLNYRLTARELEYILDHSGARVVLVDHEVAGSLPAMPPGVTLIISHDSGGRDKRDPYEAFLDAGRKAWAAAQDDAAAAGSVARDWGLLELPADEETTMALSYTSGTTGPPKGVVTTHRGSFLSAVTNALDSGLNSSSVYLWVLPMFHCCGWGFPWAVTSVMGTHYMLRRVDYSLIWDALISGGVTHYAGAPTVQLGVVHHPKAQRLDRVVRVSVAASAPTATLLEHMEHLNLVPVHVYGLTESYGPTVRRYADPAWYDLDVASRARLQARQGHAYVSADECRVVRADLDAHGELVDVARDGKESGEIVLRGNLVLKEYYRNPDATAEATRGGWFHTGDMAVRHPGGEIQIVDRAKDIIISGGENVSSLAVEQELSTHPWVAECAVVARPNRFWGETVHAVVVLRPGYTSEKGNAPNILQQHCRRNLSGFSVPRSFSFVDALPKTSTGKIQKLALREHVAKL
ncbi:cellulase [Malassezia cuniculi]|uniref:Cellulase n=1 Tax=Malassezia cuniculi TaxID=948313 RepID=A0AAF0ER65_9BASI|nr:cellulase [Malassezia cuniculi]